MKSARCLLACVLLLVCRAAWADLACGLSGNPSPITAVYNLSTGTTVYGTLRLECTRDPNGPGGRNRQNPTIWIGLAQSGSGPIVPGSNGGAINYALYHNSTTAGLWTNTGNGVAPGSATTGAVLDTGLDFGPQGALQVRTYQYTLHIPPAQLPNPPAGTYAHQLAFLVQEQPQGREAGRGTISVEISVARSCRFSTPPPPIDVTYPAFSALGLSRDSEFGLTCTPGTNYTLSLDAAAGVVPGVELAYTAGLSVGPAPIPGNAMEQRHRVTISFPAGQAGRCNTATCLGSDSRTILVQY